MVIWQEHGSTLWTEGCLNSAGNEMLEVVSGACNWWSKQVWDSTEVWAFCLKHNSEPKFLFFISVTPCRQLITPSFTHWHNVPFEKKVGEDSILTNFFSSLKPFPWCSDTEIKTAFPWTSCGRCFWAPAACCKTIFESLPARSPKLVPATWCPCL